MKKILATLGLVLLLAGCGGGGGGSSTNNPTSSTIDNDGSDEVAPPSTSGYSREATEQEELLVDELNIIRARKGLSQLQIDNGLNYAIEAHRYYCVYNNEFGHYEDKDKPFFFGETPTDRMDKVIEGYYLHSEVLLQSDSNQNDTLLNSIYHRSSMLSWTHDKVGVDYDNNSTFYGLDFVGAFDKEAPNYWKYPEMEDTAYSYYYNMEMPQPIEEEYAGYPVSIFFKERVEEISFKLYDSDNSEVEQTDIIYETSDMKDGYEFHLFPKYELQVGDTYTAVFKYKDLNGDEHTITWSFDIDKSGDELY